MLTTNERVVTEPGAIATGCYAQLALRPVKEEGAAVFQSCVQHPVAIAPGSVTDFKTKRADKKSALSKRILTRILIRASRSLRTGCPRSGFAGSAGRRGNARQRLAVVSLSGRRRLNLNWFQL